MTWVWAATLMCHETSIDRPSTDLSAYMVKADSNYRHSSIYAVNVRTPKKSAEAKTA